jgi:hypothetical protein
MSFVPAPQQANAANNAKSSNAVASNQPPSQEADLSQDNDAVFKNRTFDVLWVDRAALMYKDGVNRVCYDYRFVDSNSFYCQSYLIIIDQRS